MNQEVTITVAEHQMRYIRDQIERDCDALKNHVASAVERGTDTYGETGKTGLEYAQTLVPKLRAAQEVFMLLNRAIQEQRKA